MQRVCFVSVVVILILASLGSAPPPEDIRSVLKPQVSSGAFFSCAHDAEGQVHCWGDNLFSQSISPQGTFTQVAAGWLHACGIDAQGAVQCWGYNAQGQTNAPRESFKQISAGALHTCGLTVDGRARCWGDNHEGQASPPQDAFSSIASGAYFTCGLHADDSVRCWGDNRDGQAQPPPQVRFTRLSSGRDHICGITRDTFEVVCWGRSIGALDPQMRAIQVAPEEHARYRASAFIDVAAGALHTCALSADGHVTCWGDNSSRQTDAPPDVAFVQISAGWYHTCGVTQSGAVVCWGDGQGSHWVSDDMKE